MPPTAKRPNILFIMSDDHAANAISCYGSLLSEVFHTPHLDRLAHEGARLDGFCSINPICTPARASIMTGQYGHINGVRTLNDCWDPSRGPNLAACLQAQGYRTALFGKWHLHCTPEGFDNYAYLSGSGEQGTYQDPEFTYDDGRVQVQPGYVTDILTDMACDWLGGHAAEEGPFFMMLHHKAPHDFWEYAERHEDLFDGRDIPVPDSLFEDRSHRSIASRDYGSSVTPRSPIRSLYADFCQPDYVTGPLTGTEAMSFEEKGLAAYQKYLKDYLRTVAAIDESVGAVVAKLEEQGALDDTLVIYTSDQGMFLGEHDYQDKRWCYEESLRTPFIVRYPRSIAAGRCEPALMSTIDIAPTLLDFAGAEIPSSMQGRSLVPVLTGQPDARQQDAVYFRYWMHRAHRHDNPAHYGIRTQRWKLIFFYGLPLDAAGAEPQPSPAGWELYDLQNDPRELHNLYRDPQYRNVITDLKRRLDELKQDLGDTDDAYPELRRLRVS